jgi:glutamyl-tRNA synthetase
MSIPRVRFAPSPTGRTHLGSGRTALYNYLFARQSGGAFILRIEDTDQKRYVPGAEQELIDSLHWLGLQWDEGPDVGGPHVPYHQSQRKEIYLAHARQLIEKGHAYPCFCTPERLAGIRQQQQARKENPRYDGTCRRLAPDEAARRVAHGEKHVIRFKIPAEGDITAHDRLRGDITVANSSLDDTILVKSDGLALYHLAAMVDDNLMGITHVIRGAEWLSTFPLHVHILRAFGWAQPQWVHLSVFLKPSGKGKMSKREATELMKDGHSIFISDLRELGYLPEAVVNWIALMGWSYNDHSELFTLADLIDRFNLTHLNPAPAAINFTKMDHFNGEHIRNLPIPELARRLEPYFHREGYPTEDGKFLKITAVVQERIVTLDDAPKVAALFFQDEIHPNRRELIGKGMTELESANVLRRALEILEALPEITPAVVETPLRALVEELKLTTGQVFSILRVAVTGQTISPPLFESMEILGREKVLPRLLNAVRILENPN